MNRKDEMEPSRSSIRTSYPLIIDEKTDISIEDANRVINKFIEYSSNKTSEKKDEIDKMITVILSKLPMLKDIDQTDLFLFRKEEQISLFMKQFLFILLYYLLNIYWPQISKSVTSKGSKAFSQLLQVLIKSDILLRLSQIADSSNIWFSYVVTGVLYLITDRNLALSQKDVTSFIDVIENPIELIDTTAPNFVQFFDLLNHVIRMKFVVNCYHKLLSKEKMGITHTQTQHCLNTVTDRLKQQLYTGILPPNCSALTCINGEIILNGSHHCLFNRIKDMISDKCDLICNAEQTVRYWAALLVIILHELSHIIRRLEVPIANDIMSATTPEKILNGKSVKEAGNQLEILLFGDIVKSVGDLDSIFLLKTTSWEKSTTKKFQKQFKEHIEKDVLQQPNNDASYRLQIPGKCDGFDYLNDDSQEYNDRLNIGHCATSIYQPHSNLSLEDML